MKNTSDVICFDKASVNTNQLDKLHALINLGGISKSVYVESIVDWLVHGYDVKDISKERGINYRTIERQIARLKDLYQLSQSIYTHRSFHTSMIDRGALDSEDLLCKLLDLSKFDQDVTLGKLRCYLIEGMSQLDASKKFGTSNNVILVRQLKKLRAKVELIEQIFG